MYFKLKMKKVVYVAPEDLGPAVKRKLEGILRSTVEGKPLPEDNGIVIAVTDILEADTTVGKVLDNGKVSFDMTYEALVFNAFKGEVMDARVTMVHPKGDGLLADAGAITIYISKSEIPIDYTYETNGVVSQFTKRDGTRQIGVGDVVRLRIEGQTHKVEGFQAIGSIKGHYLGPR